MPGPVLQPLTLIVATTPLPLANGKIRLGIGRNGTLPWPRIKTDMSFFARVTSRPLRGTAVPPATTTTTTTALSGNAGTGNDGRDGSGKIRTNAIIMGRKTYDSIPGKLRPLGKRVNVVISRDGDGSVRERVKRDLELKKNSQAQTWAAGSATGSATEGVTDAFVSSSLEDALSTLDAAAEKEEVGRLYVIGGAEIYAASLRLGPESGRKVRILMTHVVRVDGGVFECDTFFPVDEEILEERGWRRAGNDEVSGWVGEEVTGSWMEEGDVRVKMVGYERVLL